MAMADKIMDDNARDGQPELLHINRTALSSSFARTATLLNQSLRSTQSSDDANGSSWHTRAIKAIPFGSCIAAYAKGVSCCLNAALSWVETATTRLQKRGELGVRGGALGVREECYGEVVAEKLAQELLWVANKLRVYGAVDEALVQWSFASVLASLSLAASPRVQGCIVKVTAILFVELTREDLEISRQVKFGLLVYWLPLFCRASNGLACPILTSFEKAEVERAMDEVISSLPLTDQEVILTNWLQDFAESASDWPNLQLSYDRWCQATRQLIT